MRFLLVAAVTTVAFIASALADDISLGRVAFNQHEIEDKSREVDLRDSMLVFSLVFDQLDDHVIVYPTENYYYFSFFANGRKYSGNFRLHPVKRDEGFIDFAYFDTSDPNSLYHRLLGLEHGVAVERLAELKYEVRYGGRSVIFELNGVDQRPPKGPTVSGSEVFIGRSVDEGGLSLLLVFDPQARTFLWVLDPEQLMEVPLTSVSPTLTVHVPSGFVFYMHGNANRFVLVGVDQWNIARNTYYDGPFDQLPDNWLANTSFKSIIENLSPEMKGQISARGEYHGVPARIAIQPYLHYRSLTDVLGWENVCRNLTVSGSAEFRSCLFGMGK